MYEFPHPMQQYLWLIEDSMPRSPNVQCTDIGKARLRVSDSNLGEIPTENAEVPRKSPTMSRFPRKSEDNHPSHRIFPLLEAWSRWDILIKDFLHCNELLASTFIETSSILISVLLHCFNGNPKAPKDSKTRNRQQTPFSQCSVSHRTSRHSWNPSQSIPNNPSQTIRYSQSSLDRSFNRFYLQNLM